MIETITIEGIEESRMNLILFPDNLNLVPSS